MGTRREITAAVVDRYRSAGRMDKGRILDELCAVTGWHRKHAVRALASHVGISPEARRQRSPTYGAPIKDDSAFMNDVVVPWCRAQKNRGDAFARL
ncbi:hypothetical protein ACFSKM_15935 [Ancylobacter dichloromethanicus]